MPSAPPSPFPGGSKERVNRAGNAVRADTADFEDWLVIDEWRAAHRHVLNTFQAILRNRTRDTNIYVAQRHKRLNTIVDKLHRFPSMQLSRMDDVAGCRLIFQKLDDLYLFRSKLHKARFDHTLKNEIDKYDYIKNPKITGYRGIHDIYSYDVNSWLGASLKGLLIEIQYRTIYQHAWATAVEVVGAITENQPKFDRGDERYKLILSYCSEILARAYEDATSCHRDLTNDELLKEFADLDAELNFIEMLRGLNTSDTTISEYKNFIIILGGRAEDLEVLPFRDATEALRKLFELERKYNRKDIVLVRADSTEEIRVAFKNYFRDAKEFVEFVESGCEKLVHSGSEESLTAFPHQKRIKRIWRGS